MVARAELNKARFWRDLCEDYEEFKEAHRIETRNRWRFVAGRLITWPGLVLYELERRQFIESDGLYGYRPRK